MGNTKTDSGIFESFKVENNRVSFRLNNTTYACFENQKDGNPNEVANEAKEICIKHSGKKIDIEFYDNEKDGKTYHNLTAISLFDPNAPAPIKETPVGATSEAQPNTPTPQPTYVPEINGAAFGLCCHLAQRTASGLTEVMFEWENYKELVKKFWKANLEVKEEIQNAKET